MKLVGKSKVALAICFLGCGASVATATQITYNLNFTTIGFGTPAGSFTYDSQAALGSQFSNFLVTWNGYTFNFTGAANTGPSLTGTCNSTPQNSATSFLLLTTGACTPTLIFAYIGREAGNGNPAQFEFDNEIACCSIDRSLSVFSTAVETRNTSDRGIGNFTSTAASPEPSTTCLGILGGSLLAAAVRRRRRLQSMNATRRT